MMIYSKSCEYAIRALAYLATKKKKVYTLISEVSQQADVPKSYIAKIFQVLVKRNILESQRGPLGGFAFKKDPHSISLQEIIESIDDLSSKDVCVMGLDRCEAEHACPLHDIWSKVKTRFYGRLKGCSIKDVQKKIKNQEFRETNRTVLSW